MTVATEMTLIFNMDMEFDKVSSKHELFIHVSNWKEITVKSTIESQSIKHLLLHHLLLYHNLFLDYRNWLHFHKEDFFLVAGAKFIAALNKHWVLEFNHNVTECKTVVSSSSQNMFVNVLESKCSSLVEPYLEMSVVRENTIIVSAPAVYVESTSHSFFELFVKGLD